MPYYGTIFKYPSQYYNYGNPLGGRLAFVDTSNGYVSTRYKLSVLAGERVQFRWVVGTDFTGWANLGWVVDEVRIYKCVPIPSVPVLASPANGATVGSLTPKLNWNDTTPAAHHYRVQVSASSAFSSLVVNASGPTVSEYRIPAGKLIAGTTYFWRARAYNSAGGASAWSAVRSFSTP
jgi:hypothetical protein